MELFMKDVSLSITEAFITDFALHLITFDRQTGVPEKIQKPAETFPVHIDIVTYYHTSTCQGPSR